MIGGLMKTSSRFAIIAAAGIIAGGMMTPAQAGGLGGDCCADLEERVAELEATTVRKSNRKVSVKVYGFVTRALMYWEDDDGAGDSRSDLYNVDIAQSGISRWGLKGGARINSDISVGYKFEWQIDDTYANRTSVTDDDGTDPGRLTLRHNVIHITSKRLGTVSFGHSHTASDSVAQIDLSGTTFFARSNVASTLVGGNVSGALFNNLDGGGRGDRVRYDSPNLRGFVLSASFGESDFWDVALRYAGQFGDFKVAAGVAYIETENDSSGTGDSGACGNVQAGSTPTSQECFMGSGGIMHMPTGLNINFAAGQSAVASGFVGVTDLDYSYWYVKGGILKNFFGVGKTGAYVEYWESEFDNPSNFFFGNLFDASGTMWGLGVVQNFDSAVFQIFLSHRSYEEDINFDTTGDSSSTTLLGMNIRF